MNGTHRRAGPAASAATPPRPRFARFALAVVGLCALGACGIARDAETAGDAARAQPVSLPTDAGAPPPRLALIDPHPLPGAGAVAFDPAQPQLAWAAGEEVRIARLGDGTDARRMPVGAWVSDLGFAPDAALWIVAGTPQLWRDGARACSADAVEADRLLAIDAQGAVVAGYTHSDGVGMLRRQVWLGPDCAVVEARLDPVPAGVNDAEADPGAPLGRASLRRVHEPAGALAQRMAGVQLQAGAGVDRAVAVSDDGRWWVLEGAQGRTLWRIAPP